MLKAFINKIKKNKNKILVGVSFIAAAYLFYKSLDDDSSIKFSSFLDVLNNKQLQEVIIKGNTIYFRSAASQWYHTQFDYFFRESLVESIRNSQTQYSFQESSQIPSILLTLTGAAVALYFGQMFLMKDFTPKTQKKAQIFPKIQRFEHFYGGQGIKILLKQIVEKIQEPQKYVKMKVRTRRGLLLHGPPGTGKTMLARILASEAQLPFISTSASQFQQIFVGVGPKKIRQIFVQARKHKKGCIILIDELDAIGSRNQNWQTKEQRSTVNQLLTEIDGFEQNQNILVVGATNNLELVDKALLRPGRFDIKIRIDPPNENDRKGILQTILKRKQIPHNIQQEDLEEIANKARGWCGADLQNLINESGYLAIRNKKNQVEKHQIFHALKELQQNKGQKKQNQI